MNTSNSARGGIITAAIAVLSVAAVCSFCTLVGAWEGNSSPGGLLFLLVLTCAFVGAIICVRILDAPRRAALVQQRQQYAAYVAQQQAIQAQQEQEAYLSRISALEGLLSLTPTEFEIAVVELLKFWGYSQVEHTGGGGDLAADIVCYDATGQKTVVQCKRYTPGNLVGSPEVQTFIGMMVAHHRALAGIYVTTSGYTEPALALGRTHRIRMIDGTELVAHMQQLRAAMER